MALAHALGLLGVVVEQQNYGRKKNRRANDATQTSSYQNDRLGAGNDGPRSDVEGGEW
jgi:hypothetical protein